MQALLLYSEEEDFPLEQLLLQELQLQAGGWISEFGACARASNWITSQGRSDGRRVLRGYEPEIGCGTTWG